MDTVFAEKVKGTVTRNFDLSCRQYRAFEEKHGLFRALALKLAERIDLQAGAEVLDVGCGNGVSALALSQHLGCRVLGVDLSPSMVADGRSACENDDVHLVVGDGERLSEIVAGRRFDYVLYNASIFIFPDAETTLGQAAACLRPGGKIAFSFYPRLLTPAGDDLIDIAFTRLAIPPPRFRVITSYAGACEALARHCAAVVNHEWRRPLELSFIQDFFSIPAQSASLFPGLDYPERNRQVHRLFDTIRDFTQHSTIVWRMAEGRLSPDRRA